jgi:DNA-binding transcriptional MocR family regulator
VSFVSSFSKTVSPGLRVGYCVPGTAELHDAFAARKTQQDLHSAVMTEVVLRKFIERGSFDPHLCWLRERNKRRRELALGAIERSFPDGTRVAAPWGGYMLWIELPPEADLCRVRTEARAAGVVFAAGWAFYAAPASGLPAGVGRAIRLNCAKAAEPDLERGVEIIGRILRG